MRRVFPAARLRTLFTTTGPSIGVEIAPRRLTAVAIEQGAQGPVIAAHATETLPDAAVKPGVTAQNIPDPAVVTGALTQVLGRLGRRARRVALVVPDSVAKVSLIRFDKVPGRAEDLDQLVRWQVRKTAPFRIEDAQITYAPGAPTPEGSREFVVALTRRDIVEEYERVCSAAGAHAGLVDLASFNLINAVLASDTYADSVRGSEGSPRAQVSGVQEYADSARGSEGSPRAQVSGVQGSPRVSNDWLLVHVTPDYTTIAIVRGRHLIFFRNRPAEGEGHLTDLVHQTAMYYEDRLGGSGFARVIVAGAASAGADAVEELRRSLEERLATRVDPIDPRPAAALRDRIAAAPALLEALAAPVGILLRERAA